METIVSAIESSRITERQRVDESTPASMRRETREARADVTPAAREPDAREVHRAAERLNEALQEFNQNLSISVNEDTGQMVVRVMDSGGKVIHQMPPEQLLEAEISIDKIIGLFVNNQV